jgi:hypothetical protein
MLKLIDDFPLQPTINQVLSSLLLKAAGKLSGE